MAKFKDETNRRYERLTVLGRAGVQSSPNGTRATLWLCRCDCGNEITTSGPNLRSGNTRSCGCLARDVLLARITGSKATRGTPESAIGYKLWRRTKQNAQSRGLPFALTREQVLAICTQDCLYCGRAPAKTVSVTGPSYSAEWTALTARQTNGIDRLHNQDGYQAANCVPCCHSCNVRKSGMPLEAWLLWQRQLCPERNALVLAEIERLRELAVG